jgi:hypothetical protein
MPGSFSYNAGSNTVTVTGGTSGSPAAFSDFVTADRAGTLNSQDTRNITGVDGSPVAVTRAIRPVERLILGGPAHTLYLAITNWNATSATIRIVGTDYDGNTQQEDIALSGNGTLYTVNRYKTITTTQVTALSGTGFTYTLTQAGWGVIWDHGNGNYSLASKTVIGDGSTSTYFKDTLKYITILAGIVTGNNQNLIEIKANATLQTGDLDDASKKTTKNGCVIRLLEATYYGRLIYVGAGAANLYSSRFDVPSYDGRSSIQEAGSGVVTVYNCQIMNYCILTYLINGAIYNVYISGGQSLNNCAAPMDKLYVGPMTYYAIEISGAAVDITVSNLFARRMAYNLVKASYSSFNIYLIDPDSDNWTMSWGSGYTGTVYRQYTFKLHLTDINGNNVSGATVTLKDNGGNTVFSVTTGADGKIAQQTVSRGYYNPANGNTLQDYGPHTLTITKAGYQDYQDIITIDRKMDLEVSMALSLLNETLEGGLTVAEALRIMLAVLAEKSNGGGTATVKFRDHADSKDRIIATVDSSGNRTAVTLDGT